MYYIYHIPGVKIGCTVDLKRRLREQKAHDYEVLEKHTDKVTASKREKELQVLYGYKKDNTEYSFNSNLHSYRTEESFKKISEALKGRERCEELKVHLKNIRKGTQEGTKNHNYGKHKLYIELSTNTIGTYSDLIKKWPGASLSIYLKRDKPISKGPYKGLHFRVYEK